MKDGLLLLLAGLACAGLAWLFFNQLQEYAFTVLFGIFLVAAIGKLMAKKDKARSE